MAGICAGGVSGLGHRVDVGGVVFIWLAMRIMRKPELRPSLDRKSSTISQDSEPWRGDPSDDLERDDERYAAFVNSMWVRPVANLGKLKALRIGYAGQSYPVQLVSVSKAERGGHLYVNCYEAGERKTYAADERHEWEVKGVRLDSSAFMGIALGVPASVALGPRAYPQNPVEARVPHNNAFKGSGHMFVIGYQDRVGQPSYRVVSRVVRQPLDGRFTANCHFRYGARRTFLFNRLTSVEDVATGQPLDREAFIKGGGAKTSPMTNQ